MFRIGDVVSCGCDDPSCGNWKILGRGINGLWDMEHVTTGQTEKWDSMKGSTIIKKNVLEIVARLRKACQQ